MPDQDLVSEAAIDFILCCLVMSPEERPTAEELLIHHPWMRACVQTHSLVLVMAELVSFPVSS